MPTTTFDNGLKGWTTTNGTEIFDGVAGDPPGSLRGTEGGSGVWYFVASNKYLGDMSDFYGGTLSFDLRQDGNASQFNDEDIILEGNGITLVWDAPDNPGTDWTSYSINLSLGSGWRIDSISGRIATEAEIRQVLASLDRLWIRGEFVNGTTDDAANLDNVGLVRNPAPPPDFQGGRIVSDFSTGVDGWSFSGDVDQFRQVASDGNPGGYLEIVDYATGDTCYFVAADKFLGNKSAFYGGTLSFDLRQSSLSSQFNNPDVIIEGGGVTLVFDTASNPGTDWTSYEVTFDTATDWRIGTLGGAVATAAEIRQVLADITRLWIRGEFVVGDDTDGLDNVVMAARDKNVRLLEDATTGALLGNYGNLAKALDDAVDGNAILIEDAAGATASRYGVAANGLTVISDAALTSILALKGVASIALAGANHLAVNGNALDNAVFGSDGNNLLRGFKGNDTLSGGGGADSLIGGSGKDKLLGGKGYDLLNGGSGRDLLKGENGNDRLAGKNGNDTLKGGYGDDSLNGGLGDDVLNGGPGSDRFQFYGAFGNDTIIGFDANDDAEKIDLSAIAAITDFTDLVANHLSTVPGGVLIDDLAGNTILLKNVEIADLHGADFVF